MLVLDGSSSMEQPFNAADGGMPATASRWSVLRNALVDPTQGVVSALQSSVRFGLAVFGTAPTCPLPFGIVQPALDNADAIASRLPEGMAPGMFTPTGAALDVVIEGLADPTLTASGPQVIILVTDGEPNSCGGSDFLGVPATDFAPSIAAALKAQAKHVEMHVIGFDVQSVQEHLKELANLGAGLELRASPGAPLHQPTSIESLTSTLRTLIEGELACDFALAGASLVAGSECAGSVTLNGSALPCDVQDGWSLLDPTHIRLHGAACDAVKAQTAVLSANFPCDALAM